MATEANTAERIVSNEQSEEERCKYDERFSATARLQFNDHQRTRPLPCFVKGYWRSGRARLSSIAILRYERKMIDQHLTRIVSGRRKEESPGFCILVLSVFFSSLGP